MKQMKYPFIICIKCSIVPLLTIIFDKVHIKCRCSSVNYPIKEYLHLLYLFDKEKKSHNIPCGGVLSHSNRKSKAYCMDCKEHLCSLCIKHHKKNKYNKSHYILPCFQHDIQKRKFNRDTLFCFDCFNHITTKIIKEHKNHYKIRLNEIRDINIREHFILFFNIKERYKLYLKQFLIRAVELWPQNEDELNKEFALCIKRNKILMRLLSSIFYGFSIIQNFNFPLLANLWKNSNFMLNKQSFKRIYWFNLRMCILFFRTFSIIEANNTFDWNNKAYFVNMKINYVPHTIKIKTILILSDNRLVLGDDIGSIILYNSITKEQYINKAHSDRVVDFVFLQSESFLSYSVDNTIKIWEVNNNLRKIDLIYSFEKHSGPICRVILIKKTIFASIDQLGVLYVWDYKNENYIEKDESLLNVPKNEPSLFYCPNQKMLMKCNNAVIYFVYMNPITVDLKKINGVIAIGNLSICQSIEDKVYIGGYGSKGHFSLIYVINVDAKIIETIINYNWYISKLETSFSFFHLFEANKDILAFTNDGTIISLNKKTLQINTRYIINNRHSLISIQRKNKNEYIALNKQNQLISFYFSNN